MLSVTNKTQNIVGYWGAVDTTTNFCEPHYSISPYVAEFFNAASSSVYIVVGLYLVHKFSREDGMVMTAALWLVAIGFGSTLFHATMRYSMQLADEWPMMGFTLTCVLAKSTTTHHLGVMKWSRYIQVGICIQTLLVVVLYAYFQIYEIFVHGYTLMLISDGVLGYVLTTADPHRRLKFRVILYAGILVVVGKIFWEIENAHCPSNPHIWPMHSVWHFFSAASAYHSTIFARLSRMDASSTLPNLLWWPSEKRRNIKNNRSSSSSSSSKMA